MLLRSGLTALEAALTELARSSTRPSTSFEASVVDLDPNFERKQNSMLTDSLSSLSTTTDQTVHEVVNSLVGKIIDEQIADPDTIRLNKRNSEQTSLRYLDECRALVEQVYSFILKLFSIIKSLSADYRFQSILILECHRSN